MNKDTRAHMIVDHVLNLNETFGRPGPPRSVHTKSPCRIISGDCRWEARLSPKYEKDSSGELWDLFELFVYGQARMTVAIRNDEIKLRYYIPGKWEPIFIVLDSFDTVPHLPN